MRTTLNRQVMNIEQVREYTLSLLGVTEDQAFGENILNFPLEKKNRFKV